MDQRPNLPHMVDHSRSVPGAPRVHSPDRAESSHYGDQSSFTHTPAPSGSSTDDTRDRMAFNRQQEREAKRMEAYQNATEQRLDVQNEKEVKGVRDEQLRVIANLLEIDAEEMKKISKANRGYSLVNLAYLSVIVGCELDLYGFAMAFSDYWGMDHVLVKLLLILCPVGYLFATAMYMFRNSASDDEQDRRNPHDIPSYSKAQQGNLRVSLRVREPIQMQVYHFFPLLRYYLVVKEKNTSDIEGIFRVNSLSSFSLGVAQICGVMFKIFVDGEAPTIFIWINIFSQAINWTITGMYFGTSIVGHMKMAVQVDALIYNSKKDLTDLHKEYLEIQISAAREVENSQPVYGKGGQVQPVRPMAVRREQILDGIRNEIRQLAEKEESLRLDGFDAKTLLNFLRLLREREYHAFKQYGNS